MLEFFNDVNPLIVDVAFIAILILIIFFGVIRGIKKNIFDFLVLGIAFFLGFCPYTNSLKEVVSTKVLKLTELVPAGSNSRFVFAVSLLDDLVASLCLFVLFYLILVVIRVLVDMILKRRKEKAEAKKSKVGRVFSGLLSLIYGGIFLIVFMFVVNNNLTGFKVLVDQTTVTVKVVDEAENIVNKLGKKLFKQENFKDKIVLKVYKGNVMYKVSDDFVESFNYVDKEFEEIINNKKYLEVLEDPTLQNEEVRKIVKERIMDLDNIAVIAKEFGEDPIVKEKFAKLSEEFLTMLHRKVDGSHLGKIELSINEYGKIKLDLKNAGLNEALLNLFDEIAEGK